MRPEGLHHQELLELDPDRGLIRFGGQRALLIDAVAMGLLRKYLFDNFGLTAARAVLTQFGFAHGWRIAEVLLAEPGGDRDVDWRRAGLRILELQGLFEVDPNGNDPMSKAGAMLWSSYEAEQHLLHFGRSDEPVCWTLCGLLSGYLSRTSGEEVYVLEDRCASRGDAACHLLGRSRAEWGDDRSEELRFFEEDRLADCLDVSLQRVTETLKATERTLQTRRRALVRVAPEVEEPLGIVAKSAAMQQVVELTRRIAKVDSTVVVTGESGCGKERIARLLHDDSPRALGPFVAINCGAMPDTLLESELFGHVRGAFTGATHDRAGLFEAAQGGTLLLDEIGEISAAMQVKLLRALQEREIRRTGENKSRRIDVRLVAATNSDLAEAVAAGTFRKDLYYRLKVVEVRVPSLRDRADDILPLARVLLAEAAERMGCRIDNLSPHVADKLLRYPWPGNVRELQNAMERAVALAQGSRVEVEDLPQEIRNATSTLPPGPGEGAVRPLADIVRDYILASLALNSGNQTRTAKQLQIGTATLYRKLKAYGASAN